MLVNLLSGYKVALPRGALVSQSQVPGGPRLWGSQVFDFTLPSDAQPTAVAAPGNLLRNGSPLLTSAVTLSTDGRRVLKIEYFPHPRKCNNLSREAEIIRRLNEAGCVSVPKLIEVGELSYDEASHDLPENILKILESQGRRTFSFMVMEYVPSGRSAPLPDVIFAMLEQKSLGVYHGDIKPENIRFDEGRGVCVFIDYDQAEELPNNVIDMNAADFLEWCDTREKQKYAGQCDTWRRHFKRLNQKRHILPLLRNGAFNLALTTPYRRQATTNTKSGVYHKITSPVVYADGVRDLKDRAALLDVVNFIDGETLLDVGCNAGLLCHYLAARGCRPTGVELDEGIVVAAKMIANIIGVKADFKALDLDNAEIPGTFDTVCLFSVIHHTQNLQENGRKIARFCKRILIECRLVEKGRKPVKDWFGRVKWVATSVWKYPDEIALAKGLEQLFPGFVFSRKIGGADKGRLLLELLKNEQD